MGLPGAGKTTLAKALAPMIGAVHFNADNVRQNIGRDLGFSLEDRIEQARRMSWLCDQVNAGGHPAIADFVCPTPETRATFGPAFTIWIDRIKEGRFADTNKMFAAPEHFDAHVIDDGASADTWARRVAQVLRGKTAIFDWQKPTALFVGRYQPFHGGHKALIEEGIKRVGQACIAVRDTHGTDEKNPFDFAAVLANIEAGMAEHDGHYTVVRLPNISHIFYGRDVGYKIERIDLDEKFTGISATKIRAEMMGKQSD